MSMTSESLISSSYSADWTEFCKTQEIQTLSEELLQMTEEIELTREESVQRLALLDEQATGITSVLK